MLIDKRLLKTNKMNKKSYEFLIRCESCGFENWYIGPDCKFGKKKYCSRKCINVGRVHSDEWKSNMSDKNSGEKNPFYGQKHSQKSKLRMSESHTTNNSLKAVKMHDMDEDDFAVYWSSYCDKLSGANNHFYGKTHSKETREHLSNKRSYKIAIGEINIKQNSYGLKGYYKSIKTKNIFRYDSFIELLRMKMLDVTDSVSSWTKRHGIRIKYEHDGYIKNFVPDFLIETIDGSFILEEVKGYENKIKKLAKFKALDIYCKKNNITKSIITYEYANELCYFYFGRNIQWLRRKYHNEKRV